MGQPPRNEIFFRTKPNPTSYISLEREFIGNSDSFLILEKYFNFAILLAILAKWLAYE